MREQVNSGSLLLAMDTSSDVCSIAVLRGGQVEAEHTFRHCMRLSERLFDHVDSLLREADADIQEVEGFAIGIGPGSFTGTRIGVMTMKTLAVLQQKPLFGVTSLEAIACEYAGIADSHVVPILPCRTGIVFAGAYQVEGTTLEVALEPGAYSLADLVEGLEEKAMFPLLFCGSATHRYGAELSDLVAVNGRKVSIGAVDFPRASQVARLAQPRFGRGEKGEAALSLVPFYIAPPPISIPKPENRPPLVP